jgi:hypothetical protein
VGDDPDVQHLRGVGVMPGRRVAGAPQLDAESCGARLLDSPRRPVRLEIITG